MRQAYGDVLIQGRCVVITKGIKSPRARIEGARRISRFWKLYQAVAKRQRDELGVGRDIAGFWPWRVGGEGLARLKFKVQRKHLDRIRIGQGKVGDNLIATLAIALQIAGDVFGVPRKETRQVDQNAALGGDAFDFSGPDGRDGEGVMRRTLLFDSSPRGV